MLLFLLFFLKVTVHDSSSEVLKGYEFCPETDQDKLNVHLIPHSHDDIAWQMTFDQYYNIYVKVIISSVVGQLLLSKDRRFVQVETAFFKRWWDEQSPEVRSHVRELVQGDRLQFAGGGWSANDEACVSYHSVIDQMTWGLKFLNETFGVRPKVGWQIDSFGHSNAMASLFAEMGFDGWFFARIDDKLKPLLLEERMMEFLMVGFANRTRLFTSILHEHYTSPEAFGNPENAQLLRDEALNEAVDSVHFSDYGKPLAQSNNTNKWILGLLDKFEEFYNHSRTNNILVPIGADFHFRAAASDFVRMDTLISEVKLHHFDRYSIFYSTPACYLKAVFDSNLLWPSFKGDFFPLVTKSFETGREIIQSWSGFYSSRPSLKRQERILHHFLQICNQFVALAALSNLKFTQNCDQIQETMGILQHHDATTGTSAHHVVNDYLVRISSAFDSGQKTINSAMSEISVVNKEELNSCLLLNISVCEVTDKNNQFVVTVYNSLGWTRSFNVRVPVKSGKYFVEKIGGVIIESQVVPVPDSLLNLTYRNVGTDYEVIFLAEEIPALGSADFLVRMVVMAINDGENIRKRGNFMIKNKFISLHFFDGQISKVKLGIKNNISLTQNFGYYLPNEGSGPYVFCSDKLERFPPLSTVKIVRGSIIEEVHQESDNGLSQIIRLYKNQKFIEIEWMISRISLRRMFEFGINIVTVYKTDIENNLTFYTDSNGRQLMERTYKDSLSIPENYYPVSSRISIQDKKRRFTVLTDRSQGGSSVNEGEIELMIQRQIKMDDWLGLYYGTLIATEFGKMVAARGKHYLIFGEADFENFERKVELEKQMPEWLFFSNSLKNMVMVNNSISCPKGIHLLTFQRWRNDENLYLIRLENYFLDGKNRMICLKDIFNGFKISFVKETTLSANQWSDEVERLKFRSNEHFMGKRYRKITSAYDFFILEPLKIRTFIIAMEKV